MKKLILTTILIFLLFANIAYSQENFMHITADLSSNIITIDSDYNYQTEFDVSDFIRKIDNEYMFTFSYSSETDFKDFRLKIVLPEDAIISEKNDALILSRPVKISTNGRRIFLEWSEELNSGEEFTAFAQYEEKKYSGMDYSLIIILFIIVAGAFFIGFRAKKFKKHKFIEKTISADEKTVLRILKKEKEIMQEDIRKKTDWSKTKISKVVRNLEVKGLVEKKPYKKTNKLKLK